jgi:hypothetical protein
MASAIGVGILGLGERTGILSDASNPEGGVQTWRVSGEAEVRWLAPGSAGPVLLRDGDVLELPG